MSFQYIHACTCKLYKWDVDLSHGQQTNGTFTTTHNAINNSLYTTPGGNILTKPEGAVRIFPVLHQPGVGLYMYSHIHI